MISSRWPVALLGLAIAGCPTPGGESGNERAIAQSSAIRDFSRELSEASCERAPVETCLKKMAEVAEEQLPELLEWGSPTSPLCPVAENKAILDQVWGVGAPSKGWGPYRDQILEYIQKNLSSPDSSKLYGDFALYSVQMNIQSLVSTAIHCGDARLLSDLARIGMAALPFLRYADGKFLGSASISKPVAWGRYDESLKHVVENHNVTSQWLYLNASVANAISLVRPENRTKEMLDFLSRYPALLVRQYERLLFAEGDVGSPGFEAVDPFLTWSFFAWPSECKVMPDVDPPNTNPRQHARVMQYKKAGRYNPKYSYCNMVLDWDIQMVAGVVELLAANRRDPSIFPIEPAFRARLKTYARDGIDTMAAQIVYTSLNDFNDKPATGFLLRPGGWSDHHHDYGYARRSDLITRPPNLDETGDVEDISGDIGHEVRWAWVLRTLYLNRNLLLRPFPARSDLTRFANQVAYKVFNGDFDLPKFHNFMDGSNGWYRVWFDKNSIAGGGPFDLGGSILNGYPFFGAYSADLNRVFERTWEISKMPASPETKYTRLRHWWSATWSCEKYTEDGWKGCVHTGGRLHFNLEYSTNIMLFAASHIKYQEPEATKIAPAQLAQCNPNDHSGACRGIGLSCVTDLGEKKSSVRVTGSLRWAGKWEVSPKVAEDKWFSCKSDVIVISQIAGTAVSLHQCNPDAADCAGLPLGCEADTGYGERYHSGTVSWNSETSRWTIGMPSSKEKFPCSGQVSTVQSDPKGTVNLALCRADDHTGPCVAGVPISCVASTGYPQGDLTMTGTLVFSGGGGDRWYNSDNLLRSDWYECQSQVAVLVP